MKDFKIRFLYDTERNYIYCRLNPIYVGNFGAKSPYLVPPLRPGTFVSITGATVHFSSFPGIFPFQLQIFEKNSSL